MSVRAAAFPTIFPPKTPHKCISTQKPRVEFMAVKSTLNREQRSFGKSRRLFIVLIWFSVFCISLSLLSLFVYNNNLVNVTTDDRPTNFCPLFLRLTRFVGVTRAFFQRQFPVVGKIWANAERERKKGGKETKSRPEIYEEPRFLSFFSSFFYPNIQNTADSAYISQPREVDFISWREF